jgi:hypothetical protein
MRAPSFDERRECDPHEYECRGRSYEVVHGVGDDHGPSPSRKAHLTASVGDAMLLISLYVRRILTARHDAAPQTASGAR